jgi:hypothetical protein
VYRARHLELERSVAIKIVRPELLDNPRILKRLTQEARCSEDAAAAEALFLEGRALLDAGQLEPACRVCARARRSSQASMFARSLLRAARQDRERVGDVSRRARRVPCAPSP